MKTPVVDAKDMQCCVAPENSCAGPKCMGWRELEELAEGAHGYCGRAGLPNGESAHINADIRGSVDNHY